MKCGWRQGPNSCTWFPLLRDLLFGKEHTISRPVCLLSLWLRAQGRNIFLAQLLPCQTFSTFRPPYQSIRGQCSDHVGYKPTFSLPILHTTRVDVEKALWKSNYSTHTTTTTSHGSKFSLHESLPKLAPHQLSSSYPLTQAKLTRA